MGGKVSTQTAVGVAPSHLNVLMTNIVVWKIGNGFAMKIPHGTFGVFGSGNCCVLVQVDFFVVTKGNYPCMKVGSVFLNEFVAFVKSC